VKVCYASGECDRDGIPKAIDYVISNHEWRKTKSNWKGSIINMSWSVFGGDLEQIKRAIGRADAAGLVMVAAAGNSGSVLGEDPANVYPAISYKVITVAAALTTYDWYRNSNYGGKIDIIAPGSCWSWWTGGTIDIKTGTSQAAPHVAGTIALFMGHEGPIDRVTAMERLVDNADLGYVANVPDGTPNALVNNGAWKGVPYAGAPFP
jgi:cerevisin